MNRPVKVLEPQELITLVHNANPMSCRICPCSHYDPLFAKYINDIAGIEFISWKTNHVTGDSCGYFGIEKVLGWFFTVWWKIDGIFVDEWVEQHSGVDISHEELEGLL